MTNADTDENNEDSDCTGTYKGVEHLVYASSSSVYGGNKKVPFAVEDKVDNPVSLYAATKKSNELLAHSYSKLYNIPSTGLRFFTVYGPAGRPDMFYFSATQKLQSGKTIQIFNYGNCKRVYCKSFLEKVADIFGECCISILEKCASPWGDLCRPMEADILC